MLGLGLWLGLGLGLGLGQNGQPKSLKHPIAAYVWVYFKLKYTGYISDGIFCLVYFVWYILSSIFCPVYIVRYILSWYLLSGMYCPDMFCPVCFVQVYFVLVYYFLVYFVQVSFILAPMQCYLGTFVKILLTFYQLAQIIFRNFHAHKHICKNQSCIFV